MAETDPSADEGSAVEREGSGGGSGSASNTGTWTDGEQGSLEGLDIEAMSLERLLHASLVQGEARHLLQGEIGKGGMGEVSIALDRSLHRPVALKQVEGTRATDVRSVASFIHEARLAARLDHPNIVPVHNLGIRDGHRVYFTMKLVEGVDLAQQVRDEDLDKRTHKELLDLIEGLIKVCDALASAHELGVVHCDIKPHNIMLGRFGAVYLMDWGLARDLGDRPAPAGLEDDQPSPDSWLDVSDDEGIVGTPSYMAPEQARGEPTGKAADIFAMGAVLYFVLTGSSPFRAPTRKESIKYAQRCAFRAPSELRESVPLGLEKIILRAMAERPSDRYASVLELRDALVSYLRSGGDFRELKFEAGTEIVKEGEPGDAAYIIASGRCEVLMEGEVVRLMGPGEVFGETALLARIPRTATVRALDDVLLMQVREDVFERELARMSPWMGVFTRTLAQRLADR